MRTLTIIMFTLLAMPATAQVFKCNVGGKVVFSDIPCEAGAKEHDVRPATGDYNAADAKRRRAETRRAEAIVNTAESERQLNRDLAAIDHDSKKRAEQRRCDNMRRERERQEKLSKEFVYRKNIDRAEQRVKELESREFFECR